MALIVTPLLAAVLVGLYVQLTLGVVKIRKRDHVSLGDDNNEELQKTIRAHANFSEWAPWALLLVTILELNGGPRLLIAILSITFIVGRVFHAKGLLHHDEKFRNRTIGMKWSVYSVMALAALNVLWMFYRLLTG